MCKVFSRPFWGLFKLLGPPSQISPPHWNHFFACTYSPVFCLSHFSSSFGTIFPPLNPNTFFLFFSWRPIWVNSPPLGQFFLVVMKDYFSLSLCFLPPPVAIFSFSFFPANCVEVFYPPISRPGAPGSFFLQLSFSLVLFGVSACTMAYVFFVAFFFFPAPQYFFCSFFFFCDFSTDKM